MTRPLFYERAVNPRRIFLSAHDTCDYAIHRFQNDLECETVVLRAGATYQICGTTKNRNSYFETARDMMRCPTRYASRYIYSIFFKI